MSLVLPNIDSMKRPIYLIGILSIFSVLILTMCAKETGSDVSEDEMKNRAIPIADYTDAVYEMTWIARSLPIQLENQPSLKALVESQVNLNAYWQTLINDVKTAALSQFSYDLPAQTVNTLNLIDPNNDFSIANLTGFQIGIDDYKTFIYIPDYDVVNKNAQIVVIPATGDDEIWGYFHYDKLLLDPQGSPYYVDAIDSLIIDENNYTNYYLWIVDAETDNPTTTSVVDPAPTRCVDNGDCEPFEDMGCMDCINEPCNGNTICEAGEDPLTCEDCNETFKLRIKSYTLKKDRWGMIQGWQEAWTTGKYELSVSFRLFTTDANLVTWKRDAHEESDIFNLLTLKRKKVCRERGAILHGCGGTPQTYGPADFALANGILTTEFREKDEIAIIFYEDDRKSILKERTKALQFAYILGSPTTYTYSNSTCGLSQSSYGYGTGAVPVLKMWIDSKQQPMFDQIDVPNYISDWAVKKYHWGAGFSGTTTHCYIRDATELIKHSDFVNGEYIIDNDYVRIVLESYK